MNILHLEASPGWGGQEMRILREAEGMRARGHSVVIGVMKGGRLAEEARAKGFVSYELNFKRLNWVGCLFQLLYLFRKHKIDLVNTHSSLDSWIGGIAARMANKRLVRTRHLSTPVKAGWNSKFVYGFLADYVVTTCESVIPSLSVQSGKHLSLFKSIATGVDPDRISVDPQQIQEFRKRWNISSGDFLVGTACFMRSWKGIDDFLEAAHILRNYEKIKWVIIGGGHAERFRKRAQDLKLDGIVQFTGHLSVPYAAIAALDAFALLSTANEGVSQAILQAAYLGRPLIATDTGGLAEVCLDGKTGFRVPPFAPRAVADCVLKLYRDQAQRERMGRSAHQLAVDNFTFEHTLNGMDGVYRLVSQNSSL